MKTAILKTISILPFEVVVYTMNENKCNSLDELAHKLAQLYTKEDLDYLNTQLVYAYETRPQA